MRLQPSLVAVIVLAACSSNPSPPGPAASPGSARAAVAPVADAGVAEDAAVEVAVEVSTAELEAKRALLPAADALPGTRVRHATAVLLFSPPVASSDDRPPARVFQPLVCSIKGKRETGVRCGEIMPAQATIRTPRGPLGVARSTKPFHDGAGQHDYAAPYGPACCMYNTCVGKTVRYTVTKAAQGAHDPHSMLAVWPADAEIALEVGTPGLAGLAGALPPTSARIDQSFTRGTRRYVAASTRGGMIAWDIGAGWVSPKSAGPGPRGYSLLGTTDVDHDGTLELISYQHWANDYGLEVFADATATPSYGFSCGNI